MTQSKRFELSTALSAAVQAYAATVGAVFRRNPPDPANLKQPRHVFFIDRKDEFIDGKGANDLRRYVFEVGAIARGDTAEAIADEDHVAAVAAMREAANLFTAGSNPDRLVEGSTEFNGDGADLGDGALVITSFEMQYRRPKQPRN